MTDETAPEANLEACARAITYYLDVSTECTRRIVGLCRGVVVWEVGWEVEGWREACARAITYYLDVSTECTRRIVGLCRGGGSIGVGWRV